MKGFTALFSTCVLSGFLLLACQRDSTVHAGNEYKARPAPTTEVPKTQKSKEHKKIKGELVRVDRDNNTLFVRVDNGTVPFKFNDCTEVEGMDQPQTQGKKTDTFNGVRALVGTEGSGVTVQWADVKGVRVALVVEINEVGTAMNPTTSTSGPTEK